VEQDVAHFKVERVLQRRQYLSIADVQVYKICTNCALFMTGTSEILMDCSGCS
jgi:hypothetical protein